MHYGKAFAVERLPLEVSEKESSKILACLAFQFVLFVLHAPRARLRRLVCCFLSVANHCSGAIPCHNHCMFVALCAVPGIGAPCRFGVPTTLRVCPSRYSHHSRHQFTMSLWSTYYWSARPIIDPSPLHRGLRSLLIVAFSPVALHISTSFLETCVL